MYKLTEKQKKEFEFFKENDDDKVMFVVQHDVEGRIEFTFDKETVYNFFADYLMPPSSPFFCLSFAVLM